MACVHRLIERYNNREICDNTNRMMFVYTIVEFVTTTVSVYQ